MHLMEILQLVSWVLSPLGQVITAVIMIRRNLVHEVPWFFAYIVFQLLRFSLLFTAHHYSYSLYFYSYWITEGMDALLVLAVINELYAHAFQPFPVLKSLSTILFRWATIILLAISVLVAASASGTEQNRFIAALLILGRSVSFVQCGLIFLLVLLNGTIGLPWRNPSRGIALGLGIASASFAVSLSLRAYSQASLDPIFSLIVTFAYDLAVVTWIAAVLRLERESAKVGTLPYDTLRSWDSALLELMGR